MNQQRPLLTAFATVLAMAASGSLQAQQKGSAPIAADQASQLSEVMKKLQATKITPEQLERLKSSKVAPNQLSRLLEMAKSQGLDTKKIAERLTTRVGAKSQPKELGAFSIESLLGRLKAAWPSSGGAAPKQLDSKKLQEILKQHLAAAQEVEKQKQTTKSRQSHSSNHSAAPQRDR